MRIHTRRAFLGALALIVLCAPAARGAVPADPYRRKLDEILARREFRASPREAGVDPSAPALAAPSFVKWMLRHLGDALQRLLDWLDRLFGRRESPRAPGGGLADVSTPVTLALGAGAGVLLALVLWRLRRRAAASAEPASLEPLGAGGEAMPDALSRPADAWARFADDFRRDGEWRLALRALYLRVLVLLHERGAIRYQRQRTNGEYVRELAVAPSGEPFRRLTVAFDEAWYGNKPCDEHAFQRALEWTRAVDRLSAPREALT